MAQILKEEIRERILEVALEEFYQHDFTAVTMRNVAKKVGISASLIYSYYKNKEALFEEVLRPVRYDWQSVLVGGAGKHETGFAQLSELEQRCIQNLLEHRKEFIILMDKSQNTKYSGEKEHLIQEIENHLNVHKEIYKHYDPVYIHIIANNFVEGLLQVMYHYKDRQWAFEIGERLIKMYLTGLSL